MKGRPLVAGVALLAAGCGSGAVAIPAPSPSGTVAAACRRLIAGLPRDIDAGLRRRAVSPTSDLTAAWGSPPVTLRCGVSAPAAFTDDTQVSSGRVCWGTPDGSADPTSWHPRGSTPYLVLSVPAAVPAINVFAVIDPLLTPSTCPAS